jgi:hypothetical protein
MRNNARDLRLVALIEMSLWNLPNWHGITNPWQPTQRQNRKDPICFGLATTGPNAEGAARIANTRWATWGATYWLQLSPLWSAEYCSMLQFDIEQFRLPSCNYSINWVTAY